MRLVRHLWPAGVMLLLGGASVVSLPRLSMEHATPCQTCHINPSGGGMRNEFGNHAVAFHELALPPVKKLVADRYKPPRLAESATFGFDVRHLVFEDGEVFRMQADAYLAVEPIRDFFYQLRFSEHGISENFGLLYVDRQRHYLKVGRFTPTHGIRVADHTAFVRSRTGNGANIYLDGLALGGTVAGVNASVEVFNPDDRGMLVLHAYRPGYFESFGLSYVAGMSARFSERTGGTTGVFPDTRAVFGGISYDRFSVQGEFDLTGRSADTVAVYAGLTTRIEYGLYAIAEYNFFDGDREVADGVDEFVRLSLEVFPLPFVELRPSYTRYTRGFRDGDEDFFLQLHIGY